MASTLQNWQQWINDLKKRLTDFDQKADDEDGNSDVIIDVLREGITIVRQAESSKHPDLQEIIQGVFELCNIGLKIAYGEKHYFAFTPSFAHSIDEPLLRDPVATVAAQRVVNLFASFLSGLGLPPGREEDYRSSMLVPPWTDTKPAHPRSTFLSRFFDDVVVSATSATPRAQLLYQARCEITDEPISSPIQIQISSDNSCLALIGAGGWKNHDPALSFFILDGSEEERREHQSAECGLSEVAYQLAMDEQRKLIFMADSYRVKALSWEKYVKSEEGKVVEAEEDDDPEENLFGPDTEDYYPEGKRGTLAHTLHTAGHDGPLASLPGGRLLRAGEGSAAVWNLDDLERHGPAKKRVGQGRFNSEHTVRDLQTGFEIEKSTGSLPHSTIKFDDPTMRIGAWHLHKPTGHMLCTESSRDVLKYSCVSLDVEHGGKIVTRFLGHGGGVYDFSTNEADPNHFVSACSDSYARMFDLRQTCPVLTFESEQHRGFCFSALYIQPDGIPTVITGGNKTESVKIWDVRAKKLVYDLSTGNTTVQALAWDSVHTTLYAATECMWIDRLGGTHEYRRARVPKFMKGAAEEKPTESIKGKESTKKSGEEEDDEYENYCDYEDVEYDDHVLWPDNAWHKEDYYGRMYDAATHTLLRYSYKDDPNQDIIPKSGWSRLDSDDWP